MWDAEGNVLVPLVKHALLLKASCGERYLNGPPIGGQHLLRKLHHLQGHERDGLGVAEAFSVQACGDTVGVTYGFHLQRSDK